MSTQSTGELFTLSPSTDFKTIAAAHYSISTKIRNLAEFMGDHLEDADKHSVKIENLTWMAETIKDLQLQQDQCVYWLMQNVKAKAGVQS